MGGEGGLHGVVSVDRHNLIGFCLPAQEKTYRPGKKNPPGGGVVVSLACYRRQTGSAQQAVKGANDQILRVFRQSAPYADDSCLVGILDRISDAWRAAWGDSGAPLID